MDIRDAMSLAGRMILVVEDEPLVAMSLAEEIEAVDGLVMGPANCVATALAAVGEKAVDVAVLDVELNGVAVFPLVDVLRERSVGLVFTSGFDAKRIPAEYGHIELVQKPFVATEVIGAILRVLTGRRDVA